MLLTWIDEWNVRQINTNKSNVIKTARKYIFNSISIVINKQAKGELLRNERLTQNIICI